ncbi:hypothetical protein Tco_0199638, partial [Tanacetum coccineum]
SGCSGSMTGDKDKLSDFKEFKGGYVAFGNDSKGGRISGKGKLQYLKNSHQRSLNCVQDTAQRMKLKKIEGKYRLNDKTD